MTELLLALVGSAVLALATTAAWIPFARARSVVAPADPWHAGTVPLSGGVPVALSLLPVLALVGVLYPAFRPLLVGALAMGVLGFVDDIRPLSPQIRVFAEMIAGVLVALGGVRFSLPPEFEMLNFVVTALWFVALINSFNLIDNMDGMAPGIAAISSAFLSVIAFSNGNFPLALTAAAVAGACLGFLRFNFAPARVFLGDSGSMMLGFLLAGLAVLGTRNELRSVAYVFVVPTLLLAVPILNTSFVILSRALTGVPIFAGRADHINYRLLAHGFSGRRAVLAVYAIVVVSGLVAILAGSYGPTDLAPAVVAALFFVTLCYIGVFLFEGRVSGFAAAYGLVEKGQGNMSVRVVLLVLQVLGDLVLLSLSFVSALLLRGETRSVAMYDPTFGWLLPVLLLVRMPALFLSGSYGYLWMYVSLHEAIRLAAAIIFGTVLAAVGVAVFGSLSIPISFWILEALVALSITSGARILPRLLHDFFRSTNAPHGVAREPVIVVGAGEAARLVLREFERNSSWKYEAIALLDDDRAKIGRRFRNVPVLGRTDQVGQFVRELGVKRVIIAMPSVSLERIAEVLSFLEGEDCHCEMLRVELALMRAPIERASTDDIRDILRAVVPDFNRDRGSPSQEDRSTPSSPPLAIA